MTAPAFIATASASDDGSASAQVTIPASGPGGPVAAGQHALLVLTLIPADVTADPTGWTPVVDTTATPTNSGGTMYLWEADITSGGAVDPGDTVTVTLSGSSRWVLSVYIVEEGAEITLPVSVFSPGGAGNLDGTLTSPAANADDESRLVHLYGVCTNSEEVATWAPHASTSERIDASTTHPSFRNATLLIADEVVAAGATPGRTAISSVRVQPGAMAVVLTADVDRPLATPGPNQAVAVNQAFQVTVTPSGGAGGPYTYQWTQVSGTTTPLDDEDVQSPTGTAPGAAATLVYQVVVTDSAAVESLPATVTVTVLAASQTAIPVSNVTVAGWTAVPSGQVFATLADVSDTTYAEFPSPPGTVVLEVALSPLSPPVAGQPVVVGYRPSMIGANGSVTVSLKQGASTVIATFGPDAWSTSSTVQQFSHELTPAQIAAVSDWGDLRLRFEGSATA